MAADFETYVNEVAAVLDEDNLPVKPYRLSETEHDQMRRVLFIPVHFSERPPMRTGPNKDPDSEILRRTLLRETWVVECLIWGTDFDDAEQLRRKIVLACRQVFGTACRLLGGTWVTQASDEARHMYGGAELINARFEWQLDLFAMPLPQAAPETSTITVGLAESEETESIDITATP